MEEGNLISITFIPSDLFDDGSRLFQNVQVLTTVSKTTENICIYAHLHINSVF